MSPHNCEVSPQDRQISQSFMSSDIMCNGHRFVKSTLLQSPGYLADLSPYITSVLSSRIFTTSIQLTAYAIKPLAQSILPSRAKNFIFNESLTCEYCLHQVSQEFFDDGRICPSLLLERLEVTEDDFILADQLLAAQDRLRAEKQQLQRDQQQSTSAINNDTNELSKASSSSSIPTSRASSSPKDCNINCNIDQSGSTESRSSSLNDSREKIPRKIGQSSSESHIYKDDLLIMQICPEIGLHAQAFVCVDCDKEIDLTTSRLCHYDGRYYCFQCNTGSDLIPIPARVLRNWDFTPKPVSKTSLQKICYLRTKPILFNLFQINSILYGLVERLVQIKQIREKIHLMLKYLEVCGQPNRPNLLSIPKHFFDSDLNNYFSLNDLFDINQVHELLNQLQVSLETHIVRNCESCRGKGFYCELCKDTQDILYPFSKNGLSCTKCHSVYHKSCFYRRKKTCLRCIRLKERRTSRPTSESFYSLEDQNQSSLSEDPNATELYSDSE